MRAKLGILFAASAHAQGPTFEMGGPIGGAGGKKFEADFASIAGVKEEEIPEGELTKEKIELLRRKNAKIYDAAIKRAKAMKEQEENGGDLPEEEPAVTNHQLQTQPVTELEELQQKETWRDDPAVMEKLNPDNQRGLLNDLLVNQISPQNREDVQAKGTMNLLKEMGMASKGIILNDEEESSENSEDEYMNILGGAPVTKSMLFQARRMVLNAMAKNGRPGADIALAQLNKEEKEHKEKMKADNEAVLNDEDFDPLGLKTEKAHVGGMKVKKSLFEDVRGKLMARQGLKVVADETGSGSGAVPVNDMEDVVDDEDDLEFAKEISEEENSSDGMGNSFFGDYLGEHAGPILEKAEPVLKHVGTGLSHVTSGVEYGLDQLSNLKELFHSTFTHREKDLPKYHLGEKSEKRKLMEEAGITDEKDLRKKMRDNFWTENVGVQKRNESHSEEEDHLHFLEFVTDHHDGIEGCEAEEEVEMEEEQLQQCYSDRDLVVKEHIEDLKAFWGDLRPTKKQMEHVSRMLAQHHGAMEENVEGNHHEDAQTVRIRQEIESYRHLARLHEGVDPHEDVVAGWGKGGWEFGESGDLRSNETEDMEKRLKIERAKERMRKAAKYVDSTIKHDEFGGYWDRDFSLNGWKDWAVREDHGLRALAWDWTVGFWIGTWEDRVERMKWLELERQERRMKKVEIEREGRRLRLLEFEKRGMEYTGSDRDLAYAERAEDFRLGRHRYGEGGAVESGPRSSHADEL